MPATEHAHCHTSVVGAELLPEGYDMKLHMIIIEPYEQGKPTRVPAETGVRPTTGGGLLDQLFSSVYVDDYMLTRVQHGPEDQTVLTASASLPPDHVRLFLPGDSRTTLGNIHSDATAGRLDRSDFPTMLSFAEVSSNVIVNRHLDVDDNNRF